MGGPIFGVSTGLNLAYLDALNAMALMSPDREIESMYSSQAMSLRETIIRVLWNAEHGTMRPALSLEADGVFQDVNAYATTLGVSPHDSRTAENIFPFDESLPSAFRGIDKWDKFGLASPYASGFALEALFATNEGERAKDLLFKVWGAMANQDNPNYSGAHWEAIKTDGTPFNHDVSLAHGWSTWPVFLLPRYLAGVYPLEAGWKKIGVTPVLAGLDMVDYSLETPQRYVRVCLHIDKPKKTGVIKVLIPEGTTAVVKAPNGWTLATEGLIQGDGTEVSVEIWG
jgi:hypothetical protein